MDSVYMVVYVEWVDGREWCVCVCVCVCVSYSKHCAYVTIEVIDFPVPVDNKIHVAYLQASGEGESWRKRIYWKRGEGGRK